MEGEEDAWVAPAVQRTASGAARGDYDDDVVDIDANGDEVVREPTPAAGPEDEGDDIPDIDDLAIEDDDEVRLVDDDARVRYIKMIIAHRQLCSHKRIRPMQQQRLCNQGQSRHARTI